MNRNLNYGSMRLYTACGRWPNHGLGPPAMATDLAMLRETKLKKQRRLVTVIIMKGGMEIIAQRVEGRYNVIWCMVRADWWNSTMVNSMKWTTTLTYCIEFMHYLWPLATLKKNQWIIIWSSLDTSMHIWSRQIL